MTKRTNCHIANLIKTALSHIRQTCSEYVCQF